MKVGIVTVWDSANMGSYLQALALQEMVKANGDEPYFIRTRSWFHTLSLFLGYNMAPASWNIIHFIKYYTKQLLHPHKLLQGIKKYNMYKKDWKLFDHVISVKEAQNMDIVMYGSDEIWNIRQQTFKNGIFFGEGFDNKKKYAYAVSVGNASIEDYKGRMNIVHKIGQYEGVYVRDDRSREVLMDLGYVVTGKLCDPTLQMDIRNMMHSSCKKRHIKYIAVYSYGLTEECQSLIQKFARERRLKTVAISLPQDWCDEYWNCSPLEFGEALAGAEYVFTTTFHGTIFSVLYHTKFVTYSPLPKVIEILDTLGLSHCMLAREFTYEELMDTFEQDRGYQEVEEKIQKLRKESRLIYRSILGRDDPIDKFAVCDYEYCTGCGACAFACPVNCISMREDEIGVVYPNIDRNRCIHCGKCKKICPQINQVRTNQPIQAYAAWSNDTEERKRSASGGIASEIYKNLLQQEYYVVGAKTMEDFSVELTVTNNEEELVAFKNSKYVFSSIESTFPVLHSLIKDKKKICMIGMPCQIAAVKNTFSRYNDILYVDLICHGMTPVMYLRQHINNIEKAHKIKVDALSFRAPEKDTSKFFFSLYQEGNCVYSQRLMHGDCYQIGYHKGISYRENCYHCIYAKRDRVSDITLGDYHGLGTNMPCDFDSHKVSVVLANTEKGQDLVNQLSDKGNITAHYRPLDEPMRAEKQLQRPTEKSEYRLEFEKHIQENRGDFARAMEPIANKIIKDHKRNNSLHWKILRKGERILKGGLKCNQIMK